jgi:alkanesulfonate monooxygenase
VKGFIGGRHIDVFTANPRITNPRLYKEGLERNVALSEKYNATGVLLFSGNDTYTDPWMEASYLVHTTKSLIPFVAIDPMTIPPFSAAKMINSLAFKYHRPTCVNWITGLSTRDREVLCDYLGHDERYDRLDEFAAIVHSLITSGKPITFQGKYYRMAEAALLPQMSRELFPQYFVAGHSPAAKRMADRVGATTLKMASPRFGDDLPDKLERTGICLGITTRHNEEDAWKSAYKKFPPDRVGEGILDLTMRYTDSSWKRQMKQQIDEGNLPQDGFWLHPFKTFRAVCPFIVGSHRRVAEVIWTYVRKGVQSFVIDMCCDEEEFENINASFQLVYKMAAEELLKEKCVRTEAV